MHEGLGIVVIGRNEGARLMACLKSMPTDAQLIYVDSGSTDGSPEAAGEAGFNVHRLDPARPFSAARGRNEGIAALLEGGSPPEFIAVFDGDTVVDGGWLGAAEAFLRANPKAAVCAGRLRERYPEASFYNQLCDWEWAQPPGEVTHVGGIAVYRAEALQSVGVFNEMMVAGEEPELHFRFRKAGWTIHRVADEMALHDAAIHDFSAWWKRARRAGYASMLGVLLHGREGYEVKRTVRSLFWGLGLPLLILALPFLGLWPLSLVLVGLYLVQYLRMKARWSAEGQGGRRALFAILTHFAAARGALEAMVKHLRGSHQIIEYKKSVQSVA